MNTLLNKILSRVVKFAALFLPSIFTLAVNAQGQFASGIDLKAAFCLPYNDYVTAELARIEREYPSSTQRSRNIRDAGEVYRKKLRGYLLSREQSLSPGSKAEIAAAFKAGEEAVIVYKKITEACAPQVKNVPDEEQSEKWENCREKNGANLLGLDMCNTNNFLPY